MHSNLKLKTTNSTPGLSIVSSVAWLTARVWQHPRFVQMLAVVQVLAFKHHFLSHIQPFFNATFWGFSKTLLTFCFRTAHLLSASLSVCNKRYNGGDPVKMMSYDCMSH